jgi:hypothetical protein
LLELRLRHIRKNQIQKITIVSSETEFLLYRFNVRVYGAYEDTQSYENNFWKKNKINLVQGLQL